MAVTSMLVLAACGGSDGAGEADAGGGAESGDLVMIGYGGDLAEPYQRFLIDPFVEDHEGVTLEQVPSESGDFVAQIKAAANNSPYDAIPLGESRLVTAIEDGWIAEVSAEDAPVLEEMNPIFADACRGYGVPATYSLIGLAYNAELVPEPTSWEDLWNEEYSGQVGIVSPSSNLGFAFFVQAAKLAGGDESNLDVGFDKIAELGDPTIAANPTALAQLFERGEIAIAPLWNNDAAVLESSGLPVQFVRPSEGAIADVTCMTMAAKTAHPELTLDLLNRVGGVEYQEQAASEPWYFGPTNDNVTVDESDFLVSDADEFESLVRIDWDKASAERDAITQRFNQDFGS
jgi:putative spermidine/putrescine transport system substrate-binding protein